MDIPFGVVNHLGIFSQEYIVVVQQNLQDMPSAISPIPSPLLVIGASNTAAPSGGCSTSGAWNKGSVNTPPWAVCFFFSMCIFLVANFVNEIGGCHRTENLLVVWIPWLCREKSYEKGFLISGNWMLFRNNKIRLERSMILCIVSVPHGKWASPRIDGIVEALDILFEQWFSRLCERLTGLFYFLV